MKKFLVKGILIITAIGLAVWLFIHFDFFKKKEEMIIPVVQAPPPVLKFGFPIDSFYIEYSKVKVNQNLSDILCRRGVSLQVVDQIARTSAPVFDVRKIKTNNNYYLFSSKDSLRTLNYFVYEIDQVNYVVYCFKDSLHFYRGQKPVTKKMRTTSGTIYSSLYKTIEENKLNPLLTDGLAEIYQWTIDFYAIQKGDQFKVIFEESFVDSTSIGVDIRACEFKHAGEGFYAFQFIQHDTIAYFNEKAQSLKKAFLKAPLEFSRISSRFSNSRFHPVLRIRRPHHGVDYAAASGTPVVSIGDGTVIRKGYQANGGGNFLYIKHNSSYTTCYMHLKGFAKGIVPGARVRQGQLIGYVGSTGLATGPHLDFRVFKNGTPVDPLKVKSEPGRPVNKENLPQFTQLKDSLIRELEKINMEVASR